MNAGQKIWQFLIPKKQQSQELTASEQLHFEDESVEGTPSERTAGTQSMEATAVVDGLRRGWEEVDGKFQAWIKCEVLFVLFWFHFGNKRIEIKQVNWG